MQVLFPNAFGHELPNEDDVLSLQDEYGFSNEYAEFLFRQNGFSFDRLADEPDAEECLVDGEDDPEGYADLRLLYALNSDSHFDDLASQLDEFFLRELFFPIGVGNNGNPFVEVLAGKYQGYICSLDHEVFGGCGSLEELLDEFGLDAHVMDRDELVDALCAADLGLVWFHAQNIRQFLTECIFCDEGLNGFVLDAGDLPDPEVD